MSAPNVAGKALERLPGPDGDQPGSEGSLLTYAHLKKFTDTELKNYLLYPYRYFLRYRQT
jgi:hypothetical protein